MHACGNPIDFVVAAAPAAAAVFNVVVVVVVCAHITYRSRHMVNECDASVPVANATTNSDGRIETFRKCKTRHAISGRNPARHCQYLCPVRGTCNGVRTCNSSTYIHTCIRIIHTHNLEPLHCVLYCTYEVLYCIVLYCIVAILVLLVLVLLLSVVVGVTLLDTCLLALIFSLWETD